MEKYEGAVARLVGTAVGSEGAAVYSFAAC